MQSQSNFAFRVHNVHQQHNNELTLEREGLFQLLSSQKDACANHSFHMESGAFV